MEYKISSYLGINLLALDGRQCIDQQALVHKVKVIVWEWQSVQDVAQLEVAVAGLDLGGEDGRDVHTVDLGLGELVAHLKGPYTGTRGHVQDPQLGLVVELHIVVALEDKADQIVLGIQAVRLGQIVGKHVRGTLAGVPGASVITATSVIGPLGQGGRGHARDVRIGGAAIRAQRLAVFARVWRGSVRARGGGLEREVRVAIGRIDRGVAIVDVVVVSGNDLASSVTRVVE